MDHAKVSINSVLSSESQPLLSPPVSSNFLMRKMAPLAKCSLSPKHICQLSKPTVAIIVINLIVSAAFAALMNILMFIGYFFNGISMSVGLVYLLVAAISLFSPLSGFLADVCFSRYTVILVCFWLHFAAFLVYTAAGVLTLTLGSGIWDISHYNGGGIALCLLSFAVIAFIVFVFGVAGYRANIIQFGLDQLLEAPSSSLALFIHWIIWTDSLGILVIQFCFAAILCNSFSLQRLYTPVFVLLIVMMFLFLFIILCFRRHWFYVEPKQLNPYKMVIKVLNYARKHKYPIQRSAFTYYDNELPSRMDFSKERYGGPFTTEQVENVKTFFRILLVLIALGPVFVLEISSSSFIFMVFGIHIGNHPSIVNQTCDSSLIILQKGSMNNLVGVLLYPLYIWFIFSVLCRCIPKIFIRLGLAILLSLLGVLSMLGIDFAGHYKNSQGPSSGNITMCMFFIDRVSKDEAVLKLHWGILLIPGVLLGLGPPLVVATVFEFISAQSPFAMKGLLVGVFLTIRAFFQLVSGTTLLPFAYEPLWNRPYLREHPPVTNCGFGYFLTSFSIAFIGLVLFLIVARRYKYRERDDRPYDQRFTVDVYGRYIEQAYSDDPYPNIPG